jgi:hypothetical protein
LICFNIIDIDYIYCNTTAYSHNPETDQNIISSVLQTGSIPQGSSLKSKKYVGENKVLFNQFQIFFIEEYLQILFTQFHLKLT